MRGWSSRNDSKASDEIRSALTRSTARTSASRLSGTSRAISPKKSPALSRWNRPPTSTCASPSRTTNIPSRLSPCSKITCPASKDTSSATPSTAPRSSSVASANNVPFRSAARPEGSVIRGHLSSSPSGPISWTVPGIVILLSLVRNLLVRDFSCTMSIASSREMKPLVSPRFAACVGHPAVGAGLLRAPQLRPAVQVVPGSADRRPAFDLTTFTKNRERLLGHEIADRFFAAVVRQAELRRYITPEHFSVDGTLLGAWAHTRAWRPRTARSPPAHRAGATAVDFRGGPRNTRTHRSTTDPEALLARRVRRVTGQGLLRV